MDPEFKDCLKLSSLVCGIVSFIIILIISWDTVEPTEWGVKYNSLTKKIETDHVYDSGRYFVFLFNNFITFPRTLKTLEFSTRSQAESAPLNSRTSEGLELELHLSFQYQLIKEELPELYSLANVDYESTFIKIASDSLRQIAGHFEASRYWKDRTFIGEEMKKQLTQELKKAHATCVYLQIMQIDLPLTYEDSIVQTQVEVQNSKIKKFEQDAAIIRQEIDILTSQTNQEIKYIEATAQADSYLLRQTASAQATQNIIQAETEQYKSIKDALGLNETELNTFVFLNGLMDSGGNLFVGFTNNMFVNQNIK